MSENAQAILLGVLGSSAFCELVRYFLGRRTSKRDLTKRLDKLEKDGVRSQLMTLIHDYPNRTDEIMEVGYHYFVDLQGNWFMTGLFDNWLKQEGLNKPTWFKG